MKMLALSLVLLACGHSLAEEIKVKVHLLDHTGKAKTQTRFWIDWSKNWRGIVSSKVVTDEAAGRIIHQLRQSLTNNEAENFCGHDPVYGVEAIDAEGKLLKTSLCFSCLTWVKPGLRLDIAGERGVDNELCKLLREVIELPVDVLESDAARGKGGASGDKAPSTGSGDKADGKKEVSTEFIIPESVVQSWGYRSVGTGTREQSEWEIQSFGSATIRLQFIKGSMELKDSENTFYRFRISEEVYGSPEAAKKRIEEIGTSPPGVNTKMNPHWVLCDGRASGPVAYLVSTESVKFRDEALGPLIKLLEAHIASREKEVPGKGR